jgi:hypothetical protein
VTPYIYHRDTTCMSSDSVEGWKVIQRFYARKGRGFLLSAVTLSFLILFKMKLWQRKPLVICFLRRSFFYALDQSERLHTSSAFLPIYLSTVFAPCALPASCRLQTLRILVMLLPTHPFFFFVHRVSVFYAEIAGCCSSLYLLAII